MGLFSLPQGRLIVLGIGGLQIAGIALLQRPRWVRLAVLLPVVGGATARRWVRPVDTMFSDTSALLRPRIVFGGILLGGLPWIGEGVAMYVLFDALGAEAIVLHEAILIHAAATLFGAVTFLPGGLGARRLPRSASRFSTAQPKRRPWWRRCSSGCLCFGLRW